MSFSDSSGFQGDGRVADHSKIVALYIENKLALRPDDAVLDVGCGSGKDARLMARQVTSITGIDKSEETLAFAREHNSAPNITYCKGDAETVGDNPDWQQRFDKVVCFFVLNWSPDVSRTLKSLLACLRPGGEGLFIVVNHTDIFSEAATFLNAHTKWGDHVHDKGVFSFRLWNRSIADTTELLKTCGWTNPHCEMISDFGCLINEVEAKTTFRICMGQTSSVPEAEQGAYVDDLWHWALSRFGEQTLEDGDRIKIQEDLMVLHACK